MDNKFGKISRISACAALKDGRTILEDLSFTAPYKIMMPFEKENGGIQIMPLCASAGIMAGDSQEFSYHVKEGADLEVLSQSFEKIHKMDEGSAARTIEVQVDKNATLYYYPQPVIPFAQSAFDSKMTIHLEDETSRLFLLEIISCGRNAHDERFQYRRFSSKVLLYRGDKLIYRDNTRYEPDKMPMEGIGMYEGYTHMANLFLSKICSRDGENCSQESGSVKSADSAINLELQEKIWQILDEDSEIDGGVTRLTAGDLALRIFGYRAQKLQQVAEKIKKLYETKVIVPVINRMNQFRKSSSEMVMDKITELVEKNGGDLTLSECAEKVGCHPSYIWRVMKNTKDMTFTDYVAGQKLEMAKRMLVETDLSVAEIAERLSYSNAQNFIRLFKKHMDITPGQYRKQYK